MDLGKQVARKARRTQYTKSSPQGPGCLNYKTLQTIENSLILSSFKTFQYFNCIFCGKYLSMFYFSITGPQERDGPVKKITASSPWVTQGKKIPFCLMIFVQRFFCFRSSVFPQLPPAAL